AAYAEAIGNTGRPTVILAKTEKGHGVAEVANKNGFHGKPLPHPEEAIAELGGIRNIHVDVPKPEGAGEPHRFPTEELQLPAYDFVRLAAASRANLVLTGSHAGVSIGEDGPSRMALEDIAALRAVHGSTVLYPSDPNQTADLMRQLPDREGIVFLRTTREKTPVIYRPGESFRIGGSRVVRFSAGDRVTLVAAGITPHEALAAAEALAGDRRPARGTGRLRRHA